MLVYSMHILIAEDNPTNAKVLKQLLSRANHSAEIAEDGLIAIEKLKHAGPFDMVFMDLQMPNLDGHDATQRIIAEIDNPPPIIACSANAFESDRKAASDSGMVGFVAKPVTQQAIETAIAGALPNAATTSGEPDGIDWDHFEMVIDDGDEESMDIYYEFCKSIPELINQMHTASQETDWQRFTSLAHQTKGTLATFGLIRLSERVAEFEQMGKEGAPDLSNNWQDLLLNEFNRDQLLLEQAIAKITA